MLGFETKVKSPEVVGVEYKEGGRRQDRRYFRYDGLPGTLNFVVHNNSFANAKRALHERVYYVQKGDAFVETPKPSINVFRALRQFTVALTNRLPKTAMKPLEDFPSNYVGRRKDIYQRAVDGLRATPLHKGDSVLRSFVKAEKVNITAKPDPAPRLIQPRSPRFNAVVGSYIKHLEKAIYACIASIFGGPTVMKGFNAEQSGRHMRNMWDSFEDPVGIDLDATRFDQHVSREMLQWEHSVYLSAFAGEDRRNLAGLLKQQLDNRGIIRCADGTIRYAVSGCRMSGDMNTAMGNCLIMCALVHTLSTERGIGTRLANNGDDCVVFCERRDVGKLTANIHDWFLQYGFQVKVGAVVDTFERVQFCQMQPLWDGTQWLLVRNPHISMSKDKYTLVPLVNEKQAAAWLHGFGIAGMSLTGGIPVLQEYYACMLRHGQPGNVQHSTQWENASGFLNLARGMAREVRPVSESARLSYWRAFDVCPNRQIMLEQQIRNTTLSLRRRGSQAWHPEIECFLHNNY